ncbi:two-component system, NarL family, invasion response regulator UvrY [Janthinobacterium sp. CG_23.3]|nr:two-component system invasion response regulator UvrY [Janthinobacterium sp. CG_S6]
MSVETKAVIRVLLADDHPIVMSGFAVALASFGIEVVGQVKTPREAICKYTELLPDVLMLDIRFGDGATGIDAAKEVLKAHPGARIIFLSQFDQDSLIKESYKIGARAFLTKDCDPADLANAVTRAHEGGLYFLPLIAERLANLSVRGDYSPQSLLDEREFDVFILMAKGMTNLEMAEQLKLSPKTISNLSQAVKEALGMTRMADIARLAIKHELLTP